MRFFAFADPKCGTKFEALGNEIRNDFFKLRARIWERFFWPLCPNFGALGHEIWERNFGGTFSSYLQAKYFFLCFGMSSYAWFFNSGPNSGHNSCPLGNNSDPNSGPLKKIWGPNSGSIRVRLRKNRAPIRAQFGPAFKKFGPQFGLDSFPDWFFWCDCIGEMPLQPFPWPIEFQIRLKRGCPTKIPLRHLCIKLFWIHCWSQLCTVLKIVSQRTINLFKKWDIYPNFNYECMRTYRIWPPESNPKSIPNLWFLDLEAQSLDLENHNPSQSLLGSQNASKIFMLESHFGASGGDGTEQDPWIFW